MIKIPKKYLHTPLALSVAAVLSGVAPISAQADARLEEIIVTSTKRDEMLSDVPISVSAMSGDKIQEAGIPSFADFSAYIPNFAVSPSAIGDIISIRGIQSGVLASIEQSVGTYVDGVYRGRATQSRFSFLDVGVIEVLRGPQGTLFGKNTIGGALNITSAAPTYELDSAVSLMYEFEHEETEVQAHVSGPLSDTVTARLAIMSREMDAGWVENDYKNPAASNDPVQTYSNDEPMTDEIAGRFSLNWEATDDLSVKFKIEHGDWDNVGQPFEEAIVSPQLAGTYAALGVPGATTPNDMKTSIGNNTPGIDYGASQTFEGDTDETALQFDYLTESGTITGILGYSAYEFDRNLDADFNAFDGIGFEEYEDFDQTSLELRYVFEVDDAEYIVGMYWQESDLEIRGKSNFNVDPSDPDSLGLIAVGSLLAEEAAPGVSIAQGFAMQGGYVPTGDPAIDGPVYQTTAIAAAGGIGQFTRGAITEQESDTIAVFAQGTWTLTDTLRLTVGGRYGEETKEATQEMRCADWDTYDFDNSLCDGTVNPFNPLRLVLGEFQPHDHNLERTEYQTTGNATLAWDATDEIMTYFTVASGVKSGGFNSFALLAGPAGAAEAEFEEEEVLSFEVGAKMMLLDGAAELNIAVFDMAYDDLQATIFTGSTGFKVENAASASIRGIEMDGRWQLTDTLQLRGSLGYLDFEFDEYDNAGCTNAQKQSLGFAGLFTKPLIGVSSGKAIAVGPGVAGVDRAQSCEQDLSGGTNPFTPELSVNLSVEHEVDLGGFYVRTVVDANFQDDHETAQDNDQLVAQDGYTTINATITFAPEDDAWDVSLIGRNITDEEYVVYTNDMPLFAGSQQQAWARPANYAIRGRVRF